MSWFWFALSQLARLNVSLDNISGSDKLSYFGLLSHSYGAVCSVDEIILDKNKAQDKVFLTLRFIAKAGSPGEL